MLQITVPATELYDEVHDVFINTKEQVLQLEHSLVSLSKWESRWCKPFLTKTEKSLEESIDYVRCMTLTQNVDPDIYKFLTQQNMDAISTYIQAPMTATTFAKDDKRATGKEIITAEIVYYWMVALTIPFECQKWHLNRLLTLINVCNIKQQPSKKMSRKDLMSRQRALNESRRASLNTEG